jgi:hypothetical protein
MEHGIHQDAKQARSNVIFEYTLMQAIADGVLHPLGWAGNGQPLIGTAGTVADLPHGEIHELFDRYFNWSREVAPTLKEEDRMFVATANNGQTVWIIDDGAAITLLYPSEY